MRLRFVVVVSLLVALALAAPAAPVESQGAFAITDLGTLGYSSLAVDVNNLGQVVGHGNTSTASRWHAFLWTAAEGMIDLGTLGGTLSIATDVNNLGQVVGYSSVDPSTTAIHAFLWTAEDGMIDLGTFGGTSSRALALNDLGQVVGWSDVGPDTTATHAFLWTAEDGMIDLGTLGGPSSRAGALNHLGQVAGWSLPAEYVYEHAVLWTPPIGPYSPTGAFPQLSDLLTDLVDQGVLAEGDAVSLASKLAAAPKQFDKGNAKAAVNVLTAVTNQLDAMVTSGRLTLEQAQPLIDMLAAAIQLIEADL